MKMPLSLVQTKENRIHVFDYGTKSFTEKQAESATECLKYKGTSTVTWINVDSVPPLKDIHEFRLGFNLHPVIEENIVNVAQRPTIEILDNYIFLGLRMLSLDGEAIRRERVSIVLAKRFVLSFQENVAGDTFEPVRVLIRKSESRIRALGTDYLCYELVDSLVNNYGKIIEHFADRIEKIEAELIAGKDKNSINAIYALKRKMLIVRKATIPMRDVLTILVHNESDLVKRETSIYLRDTATRLAQIMDSLETYREMLTSLVDVYLSSVSNRTAGIVKVLTIIGALFLPLSFITSFFGMNFHYLPGLESHSSMWVVLSAMAAIALAMLVFFKFKRWF